jgi:hypothetical protein
MTAEEALWDQLLALAEEGVEKTETEEFKDAYARLARCAALCRRLGVENPGAELLRKDDVDKDEIIAFFRKMWRAATLQLEQRRLEAFEARRGVDKDAADFRHLRENLDEARAMIIDFAWLPDKRKRVCLDKLEELTRELQRARDDFDVALAGVDDPALAATIDISRPTLWKETMRRIALFLGPAKVQEPIEERKSLPPPDPREEH